MGDDPSFQASSPRTAHNGRVVRARRARAGDFDFIAKLGAAAFLEFGFAPEGSQHWRAEHFCTWVAVRGHGTVHGQNVPGVAHTGDPAERGPSAAARAEERLGFVVLGPCQGASFELTAIAVLASERGRGVGRVLLDAAEASAKLQGAREIVAHTADANLSALELLLKRRYRIRRRLNRYYGMYAACELALSL
jgi:ribosomal protein S18 acetylase RimI-like enzyme